MNDEDVKNNKKDVYEKKNEIIRLCSIFRINR